MLVSYRVTSAWPAVGRASLRRAAFSGLSPVAQRRAFAAELAANAIAGNNPEQFRSQNAKRIGFLPGLISITSRFERPGLNLGRESREE